MRWGTYFAVCLAVISIGLAMGVTMPLVSLRLESWGYGSFAIGIAIMASINLLITAVIFVPLLLSTVVSRMAWSRIQAGWHAVGQTSDAVTGFLGELFGSVQAIKVANAESKVISHLDKLNDARRKARMRIALAVGKRL